MEENKNVYIDDLPAEMEENMCKEIFGQYGVVLWAKVMPAKGKGTSSAIVEFSTVEESQWFVENLNNNIPEGLIAPVRAVLKKDRPPPKHKEKGYGKSAKGGGKFGGKGFSPYGGKSDFGKKGGKEKPRWRPGITLNWTAGKDGADMGKQAATPKGPPVDTSRNVYINGLPAEIDENGCKEVFGQYGVVTWVKIMPNKGRPTSIGIIEFSTVEEAQWFAENLNGNVPQGLSTPIEAKLKQDKGKGGKGKGKW